MFDIAPFQPAQTLKSLVGILAKHHAPADAIAPRQARRIVSDVLFHILTGLYDDCLGDGSDRAKTEHAIRSWDTDGTVTSVMEVMIGSHYRTPALLIDQITSRAVSASRNEIFLEASEVVRMIGIACAIGNEMRRLLPETVEVWMEDAS